MKSYGDTLTADINRKGVLDVDTVKGCAAGMAARPGAGCYDACYAARIAKFRGIDFSRAVVRHVHGGAHAVSIERAVRSAPCGFFRVGTMGDPCYAWRHTVEVVEWLSPFAVPVIVTKHWRLATDDELRRLVACGAVLNTSVSALDTPAELTHRLAQAARYVSLGGVSVARIVSCDFDTATHEGAGLAAVQDYLFSLRPLIDNPLRIPMTHGLVQRGIVRVRAVRDLATARSMSLARPDSYVGHCGTCPDRCGLAFCGPRHPRPQPDQLSLFTEAV